MSRDFCSFLSKIWQKFKKIMFACFRRAFLMPLAVAEKFPTAARSVSFCLEDSSSVVCWPILTCNTSNESWEAPKKLLFYTPTPNSNFLLNKKFYEVFFPDFALVWKKRDLRRKNPICSKCRDLPGLGSVLINTPMYRLFDDFIDLCASVCQLKLLLKT